MTATRGIVLVAIVVFGLTIAPVTSAALAGAVGPSPNSFTEAGSDDDESEVSDTTTASGTNVSEFVHSSTANAETTVDSEMFNASYERADDGVREEIVRDRIESLEQRTDALESERESLRQDELSEPVYQARMTQLAVELSALDRSIDTVDDRATETGVDDHQIEQLRANASDLHGEEVAEAAAGLAGVDVPGDGDEPPKHTASSESSANNPEKGSD